MEINGNPWSWLEINPIRHFFSINHDGRITWLIAFHLNDIYFLVARMKTTAPMWQFHTDASFQAPAILLVTELFWLSYSFISFFSSPQNIDLQSGTSHDTSQGGTGGLNQHPRRSKEPLQGWCTCNLSEHADLKTGTRGPGAQLATLVPAICVGLWYKFCWKRRMQDVDTYSGW